MPARFRLSFFALCASVLLPVATVHAQSAATSTTSTAATSASATAPAPAAANPALTTPADAAKQMINSAIEKMKANNGDGAIIDLTQAIKTNPNATGAYVLRASIYCQQKKWNLAEDDFNAARKLAPTNTVLKFNLIEIKFMQKEYDVARTGFLTLVNDPDMGDFASYKVFLCDLFGGHEDVAKKELDVFDAAMGNPSYYFANAAWSLYHKNLEDARGWLVSASRIYPLQKNQYYAQSLHDLGYLPIPAPGDTVTPAPAQ